MVKTSILNVTTQQQLSQLVKSARDIMRKDKGLNGDLDRLPMLTWVMFLKFFDDLERTREAEAELGDAEYGAPIEGPYRWRDWASDEAGISGPELIAFITHEEAIRPDGTRGKGLFAYLRSLESQDGHGQEEIIATIFRGVVNRMESGYLLRDVINKVNGIHFTSSEEIHTLSRLYESMLREMRDAAGDSGEFYTPRPVVKFMVQGVNPRLGDVVLDPACGTGGFLVEAFDHLAAQAVTVRDRKTLQEGSVIGQEAKPLAYMLGQMNLLLHGLEHPDIRYGNSLATRLSELGDAERVDVILTNPPFGGEEESSIKQNFPANLATSETALLFLQLIMRKLRRPGRGRDAGRAAVVVPDGILTQDGVAARVRQQLLEKYNLTHVVRLPRGVFEPYTKSSTSILFFDASHSTSATWFYEVPVRAGVKAYSLTQPFRFEELLPVLEWMRAPAKTDLAWLVDAGELTKGNFSLVRPNPSRVGGLMFPNPKTTLNLMAEDLGALVQRLKQDAMAWQEVRAKLTQDVECRRFGRLVEQVRREEILEDGTEYPILAMSWYAKGLYVKHVKTGAQIKATKSYRVEAGDFVYNRLFAWKGSFAEATADNDGCYVSNEFPTFRIVTPDVVPGYLWAYFGQPALWAHIEALSTGTTSTSRLRLKEVKLLDFEIPIPSPEVQGLIVQLWQSGLDTERALKALGKIQQDALPGVLERTVPHLSSTGPSASES